MFSDIKGRFTAAAQPTQSTSVAKLGTFSKQYERLSIRDLHGHLCADKPGSRILCSHTDCVVGL